MSTKIKSKLDTTMNCVAKEITGVSVISLGETPYDGEVVTIEFINGAVKHINTNTNVISNSLKVAYNKKTTNCKLQNGRLTTVLYPKGYVHGARIQLGTLLGIAKDFLNDTVPKSYVGLSINHIDRTGNKSIYGYINNRLYNLETTSDGANSSQWPCVRRVQKLMNVHIGLSANDTKLLDILEFGSDEEIVEAVDKYYSFEDKYGTKYLSTK